MRFGESVSKMCKQPSNSNNGEKYEKEFEWVQYWKRGINLLWRELVGLLMFVVQLQKISSPLLYRLCTLQPLCPSWLQRLTVENLASLCLEGDIGRGLYLIHCIFSSSSIPVGSITTVFICSLCSSAIRNAGPSFSLSSIHHCQGSGDVRMELELMLNVEKRYCKFGSGRHHNSSCYPNINCLAEIGCRWSRRASGWVFTTCACLGKRN